MTGVRSVLARHLGIAASRYGSLFDSPTVSLHPSGAVRGTALTEYVTADRYEQEYGRMLEQILAERSRSPLNTSGASK